MIRLVVQNQVTEELQELDTFGNENIALTLQVDDVRDIESKNASYSKDFNLPATKRNNKFFEHYYDLDRYTTNYNIYKNVKAYLYVNDLLILEGFLRLLNVVDKDTEITYNVVLFNDVANIIESLADATINDLDFSDINHEFNPTNVINSWADNAVVLTAGGTTNNVYYPLINDGNIFADEENLYIDYKENYVLNVNLKYVIDKIFDYVGFSYDSDFFNTTYFKDIFFDIGRNNNTNDFVTASISADTGSGTDTVGVNLVTTIDSNIDNATVIDFVNETGDTGGIFNHDTSVFTAPYDCNLNIEYTVTIYNTSDYQFGVLRLFANETEIGYTYINEAPALGQVTVKTHTFSNSIYVAEGDTVTLQFIAPFAELYIANTGAELTLQILDLSTDTKIKSNRGDIKLADILKDVVTAFNLTIESEQNNLLKIEPYNDFITDNILDWTKKVNANEMVVEPIEIPKRISFTHLEDSDDYYHEQYKYTQLTDYGKQTLEFDVDNDEFVEIRLNVFAAPFIKELDNTNINLQHIATSNDEALESFDNAPRLIFKNKQPFDVDLIVVDINDGLVFGINYSFINNGTPYEGIDNANPPIPQLTSASNSLLFGYTNPTYIPTIGAIPLNTLFNKYWFTFVNEKFNITNGLILKTEVNLNATDINSFTFANKVRVQDQLYRVNKIEYNTDENSLAKVELLRI